MKKHLSEKMGIDTYELAKLSEQPENIEKFDKEFDRFQVDLANEDTIILDSRMGFHRIPKALKIYLTIDPVIAAQRIYNNERTYDNYESIEKNIEMIAKRDETDRSRLLKLYGVDCQEFANFDLVIDSGNKTIDEITDLIINHIT